MRRWLLAALSTSLIACLGASPPPPEVICHSRIALDNDGEPMARVFAIGLRQDVAKMTDHAAYRKFIGDALAAEAPCFSPTLPNLVVFPEDANLVAAFIGTRGAEAREQTDDTAAFAHLFMTYKEPLAYYRERFPGTPSVRTLLLALTDTFARAIEETFPKLARDHSVYIATSVIVAEYEATTDPELIRRVGDPDLASAKKTFVASGPEVYNFALIYGPDGKEISRVRKAYLVPSEESLLQLNYGRLEQLVPAKTPAGRLAAVISKDAWMPDVLERFNDLDADITLQYEAFSGWAVEEHAGDWLPEVVQQSGWNHLQAYDSFRFSVFPCLSGNLFTLIFDCQSAVLKEAAPRDTPMAFIGQDPYPGFLDIGPWVIADPAEEDSTLTLEERRRRLRQRGEALRPGAGAPYENQYVQTVARADMALLQSAGKLPVRAARSENYGLGTVLLDPGMSDENQIRPDLAFDGSATHAVWIRDLPAERAIRYVNISANGDLAGPAQTLPFKAKRPYGARVTATSSAVYAVAVEDADGGETSALLLLRSDDGGATWLTLDKKLGQAGQWARWNPTIAAWHDRLYIAWTDRRAGSSDIYLAVSLDRGETFQEIRLDEDHLEKTVREHPANTRNNQALPAVAARGGEVVVSWADFREYNWDIYAARSTDGALTWGPNERLNPPSSKERIFGINSVALSGGATAVFFDGVDDRGPHRGVSGQVAVDGSPAMPIAWARPSFRPHVAATATGFQAVWQSFEAGELTLRGARFETGNWGPAMRLTSTSGAKFNPRSAGDRIIWEDWGSGRGRVILGSLPME
jgi:hypothetical protein